MDAAATLRHPHPLPLPFSLSLSLFASPPHVIGSSRGHSGGSRTRAEVFELAAKRIPRARYARANQTPEEEEGAKERDEGEGREGDASSARIGRMEGGMAGGRRYDKDVSSRAFADSFRYFFFLSFFLSSSSPFFLFLRKGNASEGCTADFQLRIRSINRKGEKK